MNDFQLDELLDALPETGTRTQALFFGFIFVLIVGLSGVLLWWGEISETVSLESQIQQKLTVLEKQAKVIEKRLDLERELVVLRQRIPDLIEGFPAEEEVAGLLDTVYRGLGSNGLYLWEFEPKDRENQGEVGRIPVRVRVEGGASQVSGIPNLLATLSRKVNLANFEMSRNRDSSAWGFRGQLVAFSQLPEGVSDGSGGSPSSGGAAR